MRSITEDILQWSEKFLEPKNKHLGEVSVCPYAKMVELIPCKTESTQGLIFVYTSFWDAFEFKTWLKL